jgi:hypothetical protein
VVDAAIELVQPKPESACSTPRKIPRTRPGRGLNHTAGDVAGIPYSDRPGPFNLGDGGQVGPRSLRLRIGRRVGD